MMGHNESTLNGQVCVLVIDDDDAMRQMLSQILMEDGHFVVTASSAEDALSYLPSYTFQVAFIDHNLPGMEGLVLGEFLRTHNPRMGIALVTGTDDARLARLCFDHRIQFIQKPFQVEDITGQVSMYLERMAQDRQEALNQGSDAHHPRVCDYLDDITDFYEMPGVPSRLERQLVFKLNQAMTGIRSTSRYNERDRVMALAGLLAARVLGLRLSTGPGGISLEEEYDALVRQMGRAGLFSEEDESQ